MPAGHAFVAPSLLAVARSEDELAGLLGHEIIHAHGRHSIKRLKRGLRHGLLSLHSLSDEERQSVTAVYLRGVTARAGVTLESLGAREGNVLRPDLLALVNGVATDASLAEGQPIRIGRREPYRSRGQP